MSEITLIIPNRTHAFPINVKGVVTSNENSGTDIFAFIGSQKATPVDEITGPLQFTIQVEATNMFAGQITKDLANKKFVMGEIDGSSIGIDDDLIVVSDINSDNAADFKNIPSTKGQLQFVATVSDANGVLHTKVQTCDYVKSRSLFTTDTIFLEVGTRLQASTESIMDPEGIKQIKSFNWYSGENIIEGQTGNTYVVRNQDVGKDISAVLKYIDGKNNTKEVIAIQNIFIVDSAPINFPLISGIPESGQTLTADTSYIYDRNGIATDFEYIWSLDEQVTDVITSDFSIKQGEEDSGKTLSLTVKYTDGAGIQNTLSSPSVVIRDSAAGDTVQVIGSPRLGENLQASIQTADQTTPTILSYEWRRDGKIIEGEETNTYTVKRIDINSFLTVTIKYDAGSGVPKYKTSGIINFENSPVNGLPILNRVLEDGSKTSDLTGVSVGSELFADVSGISDPDDIKDFYYPFDNLTDANLLRDKVSLSSVIGHKTITTKRSSTNQSFVESSDEISYSQVQEVQSIYVDNSLGNAGDTIYIQYKDSNNVWKNALQIDGKVRKYFFLDQNISSTKWRMSFIASSADETAATYSFEAQWALESPSILSTRKFVYQWVRTVNGVEQDIIGATKQKYLISQSDLNATVHVKVSFVDGANQISSLESNSVSVQNYAPTGKVIIEGTAKVGSTLTIKHDLKDRDNISASNLDGSVTNINSYQWFLDGVAIQGATSKTLLITSTMQTKTLTASLTYTDSLNAEHTVKTKLGKKVNASPTGEVKIFGTPKVGKQLTVNTTNLKDLNQFNQLYYQWILVNGSTETEISNASLQTYTVKTTDIGKSIKVKVYYTDNDGFQESIITSAVSILDSETTGEPSIQGTPVAGGSVTANISNISDENGIAGYSYQWRIDEQNVEGAVFSSFTIQADEQGNYGNYLDVAVTVEDNAGNVKTLYSDPVRIALAAGTVGADGGTITGENVVLTLQAGSLQQDTVIYVYETTTGENPELPEGSTLVGTAWAFTPHGTVFEQPVTIQFEVPEGTNLVLRADDENDNSFEIVQNYSVTNTTATLETNTFSVYVGSVFTPAVITGVPEQGNYLTASVSGDITDVTFQWKRNGENILNAQNEVYLVKQEDVGQILTVAATFTDVNGVSTTKTSAETQIINSQAEGQVNILGSRRVGVTLESQIVNITDVNTVVENYSYQWFRNGIAIEGAQSANYEVTQNDFLKDVFVRVSFLDAVGNQEHVDSQTVFISKKGSVFFTTNSRKQGDTLTVDTSTLTDFYSSFQRNFTWYLDNQAVAAGSTLTKRTLGIADSGRTLKAIYTYVDGRGTHETLETDERFIYTISSTITPAGGTFSNQNVTLNVPAGAVDQNVDILVYVVRYDQDQLPIGTLSDQVGYAFTPLDLSFNLPITITLPKPNDEYDMVLYGTDNSVDEFIMADEDYLTVDNANNKITIQTDNFGVYISAILYVRVDIVGIPEQGQVLDTTFIGEVFSKTYQWYRGETPIAGETGTTYTVTLQDVGEEIKVISTYLLEETSGPEIVESEPVLIVNSLPVVDTSVIISGEDRVGETLTASPSGIFDANNPDGLSGFLYQWKTNGQEIAGATSDTLTLLPEHFHTNISVEITYIDATGLLETVISDNFYITRIPPSGYVEVIGVPEVDEYLEVDTDNLVDLNGIGEFSYQWHADGVDLSGETNATLLVTSAMEDKAISVTLTYTDGVGEVEVVTSRNAPVIDADPTGAVVINYTKLEVAQTLTANTSTIADANQVGTFSYQWKSDGVNIPGATSKTYVVANQFCNTDITVTATYVDGDGYIETLTSEPVTIVNSPVQGLPTVSGNPDVSATLTINTTALSDVNVLGTLNYKWFADGVEIVGATSKTWVVDANSYVGKTITGQVYYIDGAGNSEQANTSNGITIQNSLPTGKPTISGVLKVGQTLTAVTNAITDFNVIVEPFYYQWKANGVAIQGATEQTYVVQVLDINKDITVAVSFYDEGNTYETVVSNNYRIINTPATGYVEILYDSLEQGSVMSVQIDVQDDNEIISAYSYQWTRDGLNIYNATSATYTLANDDWNADIRVKVSFTDRGGVIESFTSEPVRMINSLPTGEISIVGSPKVGETLEADISDIVDNNGHKSYPLVNKPTYTYTGGGSSSYKVLGSVNSGDMIYTSIQTDWGKEVIYHNGNGTFTYNINFGGPRLINQIVLHGHGGGYTVGRVEVYYKNSAGSYVLAKAQEISYSGGNSSRRDTVGFGAWFRATEWKVVIRNASNTSAWNGANSFLLVGDTGTNNLITEQCFYQWRRDGEEISGATEKTYVQTFDDLYKTLTVDVTYVDGHGNIETPNNTAATYVENSPPEGTVLIHGTRNVGESLYFTHNVVDRDNVTLENPTGLVTFSSYQWYKSETETGPLTVISEATGSTLLLTTDLQAKWIALDATYVDIEGDDDTVHASNRLPVKSTPTGNAVITSAGLEVGRQVFLNTSTIADLNDLGAFSYQWYRTEGAGSVAIEGATQTHYSFQPADLGENIYCIVSYTDGDGDEETVTSNNLGPVVENLNSIGTVSITKTTEINGEITSDVGNILVMNNFETVAPVVAYNFHSDTRDVSPNGLHLAGTNFGFDAEGGLDLSRSTSAYLRTSGVTPVLNNDTHTISFKIMMKGGISSSSRKIFSFGRSGTNDGNPEIWWFGNTKKIEIDYVPETSGLYTSDLEPDTWYDLMFVKQGSVCRVYVDGIVVGEYTGLPNPKSTGNYKLEFGGNSGYGAAPVIIKDFQIFDFAVDAYTSASNYPFYTQPTLSYQWKADGSPIAGETNATLQLAGGNNDLGKDITLEVSLTDALGNTRTIESNACMVIESELEGEINLIIDGTVLDQSSDTESIVLYMEGESLSDNSDYGHQLQLNGNVAISALQSKFGTKSIYFDGDRDYITVTASDKFNFGTGNFTIAFWMKTDVVGGNRRIFQQDGPLNNNGTQLQIHTSNTTIALYNAGGFSLSATRNVTDNQWHHVAVTRAGNTIRIFIDGILDGQGSTSMNMNQNSSPSPWIGAYYTGDGYYYSGYLDDFAVYKGISLYETNFTVPTSPVSAAFTAPKPYVNTEIFVDTTNVTDLNGIAAIQYQWYANNAAIAGATSSSYVVTQEEINKNIRVKAVFEDETGRKSARLSNGARVKNTPAQGSVVITSTGTFEIGNALLANPTITDDNGITNVFFNYQWFRDGSIISGEVGRAYVIKNTDIGKQISVNASFTDKGYSIETITSEPVTILDSTGIGQATINGIPKVGEVLAIDVDGLSDPNGITSFSYQWRRNGNDLSGETNQTYTVVASDYAEEISVVVTYVDGVGNITTISNIEALRIVRAAALGSVTITGNAEVLSTLTVTSTIINAENLSSLTYQWYSNGSAIAGATGETFEISRGYEGKNIHVVASYVEVMEDGTTLDVITVVSNVVEVNNPPFGSVSITGTPKKGQQLTADTSDIIDTNMDSKILDNTNRDPYTNEVYYDFTKYTATNSKPTDIWGGGTNITEVYDSVEFSSENGATFTHGSSDYLRTPSVNLLDNDYHTIALRIKFNANYNGTWYKIFTYGRTYGNERSPGLWWNANQNSIHWRYNPNNTGTDAPLSINRWYDVVGVKEGSTLKIYVDGVLAQTATVSSPKSGGNSNIIFGYDVGYTAAPMSIKQAVIVPQALTQEQVQGIFALVPLNLATLSYQWQREISNGVFQNISGATSKNYTPVNTDVEKKIRCVVSYTDEAGFNETINSVPVLVENSLPTGVISFSGTRKTGNTIVASISNISDANGIATIPEYQWKLDGEVLVGQTGNSYTVISSDVGKELTLQLTYTDGVGILETEEQSAGVIEDSITTGQVDITGDFTLNGTITADVSSIADLDGVDEISYQWMAENIRIPGATSQSYILNDSDMRRFNISVEVSVMDSNGIIKTFSKKKWFDQGAMVTTYKWYHFDDLNHILNFQANNQLVTNNLQLHLDANNSDNFNGSSWIDSSSNSIQVQMYNNFETSALLTKQQTKSDIFQDITQNSYYDDVYSFNLTENDIISGNINITLDAWENYYRQYRDKYCGGYENYSCFTYCTCSCNWGCWTTCSRCAWYYYGAYQYTSTNGSEYSTSQLDFYLVTPAGKEILVKSGNFSRNSNFSVPMDQVAAAGTWKIRIKAPRGMWDAYYSYDYGNSQGYYSYSRYIKTSISFDYTTIDGETKTYSSEGILDGYNAQEGSVEALVSVEHNKRLNPLEQITVETFVHRDSWTTAPSNLEYIFSKQGYEMYIDGTNTLVFSINGTRTASLNLTRFNLTGWNYITTSYDGNTIRMYINGNLYYSTSIFDAQVKISTTTDILHVGSEGLYSTRFKGKMSSIKLYDRALTRKEILSNYNYELDRNGLTEKTFSLQSQDTYLVTSGKVGSYNTTVATEQTKELRGYFVPLQSGTHTFYVYGADKGYLWVGDKANERISISNADITTTSNGQFSYSITLEADKAYPIRFVAGNSYEQNITTTVQLAVSGPGFSQTTNLQNYLFGGDAAWKYWDTIVAKTFYYSEDFEEGWDGTRGYDFTGVENPWNIISQYGLNTSVSFSGWYRWNSQPQPEFGDNVEFSLEETFEDLSWDGPNKFDWTDVQNPEQVVSTFGINGYTSFADPFKWTTIPTATFSGDVLVEETFEDDSWTGFTRTDWTGVENPNAVGNNYGIQGYWTGTHDWISEPTPEFQESTFVFSEEFEDTSWTGYTRFDWSETEDPVSVVSGKDFAAHWEGQFKWSERAQPSFSEKSLVAEEGFEEDWTI